MIQKITSATNPLIKELRALATSKKARRENNRFILEGWRGIKTLFEHPSESFQNHPPHHYPQLGKRSSTPLHPSHHSTPRSPLFKNFRRKKRARHSRNHPAPPHPILLQPNRRKIPFSRSTSRPRQPRNPHPLRSWSTIRRHPTTRQLRRSLQPQNHSRQHGNLCPPNPQPHLLHRANSNASRRLHPLRHNRFQRKQHLFNPLPTQTHSRHWLRSPRPLRNHSPNRRRKNNHSPRTHLRIPQRRHCWKHLHVSN